MEIKVSKVERRILALCAVFLATWFLRGDLVGFFDAVYESYHERLEVHK